MRKSVARLKGVGFILWHARHEFYHVLLGLIWAWILREVWQQFNGRWVALSVFGALLPDADHILYFVDARKQDPYVQQIIEFLKAREWRTITMFIESGHKYNTNLSYHNYYFMMVLALVSVISFAVDWKAGVILFGAMLTHYLFDIADDVVTLGYINPNWKRWGKPKK